VACFFEGAGESSFVHRTRALGAGLTTLGVAGYLAGVLITYPGWAFSVTAVDATIILPLTFVAGVYGMNFSGGPLDVPELGWQYGYPAVMMGMALILVDYFRLENWL
jgi:hypothetical protein